MAGLDDDAEQRGPDFTYDRAGLNAQEQNPSTTDTANENPLGYEKEDQAPSRAANGSGWKKAANWALDRRKRLLFGVAGAGLLIAAAMAFFTLTIAPIAFLDGLMPDLDTSVGSLVMAHNSLLITKLLHSSEAVTGCKTLSVRCKFSTMSKEQVARYEKAGFAIEADGKTILGRTRVKSITFQGKKYTPEEFLKAKAANPQLRNADTRANNMRYLSTATSRFANAVLKRFGITKQKPGLSGSKTDRVNQLLTNSGKSNPSDLTFTEVRDDDGKITGYKLDGDPNGTVYTPEEYAEKIKPTVASYSNRPVMSKIQAVQSSAVFQGLASAASITGYADLACSLYQMVGAAAVAAKINTLDGLIKFAQPTFALIQSVKAGDETGASENLAALGELLTKVDTRQQIWDSEQGKMVANPNYNSSAMTSPLVQMSGDGKVRSVTAETLQFTSGLSVEKLLGTAGEAYTAIQQHVSKAACGLIQNWFVRGASLIVGVVAAIGSSGTSFALSAAISVGIMGAMYVVQTALSNAIHGPDLASAFESGSTETIGSALWLALAGMMGTHAASVGMVPGNTSEITTYQTAVLDEVNSQYAAMEKEDGQNNPLDTTNQYSFLGSAARQFGSATNYGSSPVSIMTGIVALATGHTSSTSDTAYANAELTSERFEQCSDKSYSDAGLNADVGCNLRYIMMPEDITKMQEENSADTVAKWMEDSGYVDKDTTTGLPIGYQPIDTSQAQNAALQFVTSTADGIINQFYNTRQYGTGVAAEYGKFLDYCVNRTLPYGDQIAETQGQNAINGVDAGWLTGAKCREHSGTVSNFRVYNYFLAAQDAVDEVKPAVTTSSPQPSTTTPSGSCPAGTTIVNGITQGWKFGTGKEESITLCTIPDTKMTGNPDWSDSRYMGTTALGVKEISVNSEGAASLLQLVQKAKSQDNQKLVASVGYRSNYEQCSIYIRTHKNPGGKNCPSWITAAGGGWETDTLYSNHMMGYSIDFVDGDSKKWMKKCVDSHSTTEYDGKDDNRCFGFWDDVNQKHIKNKGSPYDQGHFTYDP